MIRYYNKYKKSDPVQKPHFEYSVNLEFRFNDRPFSISGSYANDDDPMVIRGKVMTVYSTANKTIEFLIKNGFFDINDVLEYSLAVYSRIGNDTIQLLGGGDDKDLEHLSLEFTTMDTFGYVPNSQPKVVIKDNEGENVTIIPIE